MYPYSSVLRLLFPQFYAQEPETERPEEQMLNAELSSIV